MSQDEIIRMARDAGMERVVSIHKDGTRTIELPHPDLLQRFAALVAEHERQECAKVCEDLRDLREEARAQLRVADALKTGDEESMLRALRHDSNVHLYNCGLNQAAAVIRARNNT